MQKQRDSLVNARVILERDFKVLKQQDSIKSVEVSRLDNVLVSMQNELDKTKSNFNDLRKNLEDTQNKINDMEKSPSNRTGNDLLNSIKIKTK
jgi:peptidoglycan hydrolase CwlO-like protein